jgi:hypothetical protein
MAAPFRLRCGRPKDRWGTQVESGKNMVEKITPPVLSGNDRSDRWRMTSTPSMTTWASLCSAAWGCQRGGMGQCPVQQVRGLAHPSPAAGRVARLSPTGSAHRVGGRSPRLGGPSRAGNAHTPGAAPGPAAAVIVGQRPATAQVDQIVEQGAGPQVRVIGHALRAGGREHLEQVQQVRGADPALASREVSRAGLRLYPDAGRSRGPSDPGRAVHDCRCRPPV